MVRLASIYYLRTVEQFPRGLPHESAERSMYHIRTVEQVPQALPSQAELIY